MRNGKYIVIDGIAPAKTALVNMLAKQLQEANLPAQVVNAAVNASSNPSIEAIERLIHDPAYPMHNRTEVLLYNALQAQSSEAVRTTAEQGAICLSSESYLSTLVTEYYGKGTITDYYAASTIMQFAIADTQPDLIILLDTSAGIAASQQEQADQALFERLRAGYLWEANQRNIPVLYTTDDLNAVFQQIWSYTAQALSLSYEVFNRVAGAPLDFSQIATVAEIEPPIILPTPAPTAEPAAVKEEQIPVPEDKKPEAQPEPTEAVTITFEPISIFASEQLEPEAIHTGLQKSLIHTPYEQKDEQGHYRYYIPIELRGKVRSQYIRTMNQHFTSYGELFSSLSEHLRSTAGTPQAKRDAAWEERLYSKTRQLLQPVLPLAATVSLPVSSETEDTVLIGSNPSIELQAVASRIDPNKKASSPDTAKLDAVNQLVQDFLPAGYTFTAPPLTLTNYYPRNELDLAATLLYPHSDLPLQDLRSEIGSWPYDRKVTAITAGLSARKAADRPFTDATYSFDLVTDYATFRLLQQQGFGTNVARQSLTPRHGYDTPAMIEDAGLSDQFDDCFDRSLELYSALQAGNQPHLAPYGALLGHKVRWSVTCTLADISRLRHSFGIIGQMAEKVTEVHPLVSELLNDPRL